MLGMAFRELLKLGSLLALSKAEELGEKSTDLV